LSFHANAEDDDSEMTEANTRSPRLWRDGSWTARVIKNDDDEGWAVAMIKEGQQEPALVGPWTMGRDKKNPKPLDSAAFSTLVKTASEVIRRHEQQLHAMLHKKINVVVNQQSYSVTLDIVPDDDTPSAMLQAFDQFGEPLAKVGVSPAFVLTQDRAQKWIASGYAKPQ